MLDASHIPAIVEVAADMMHPRCREIVEASSRLHARGAPADPITIAHELGEGEATVAALGELMVCPPSIGALPHYLAVIRTEARRRRLVFAAAALNAAALSGDDARIDRAIAAIKNLHNPAEDRPAPSPSATHTTPGADNDHDR